MKFVHSEIIDLIREHWLSNVAHNLSNPLFAARGYLRMVLAARGRELSADDFRYLALALENIDNIVFQVRRLENFPAMRDFEFTSFCIRDLIRDVLENTRSSFANRNIRLKECLPPSSAVTIGDRAKVYLALKQFMSAAASFAIPDGILDVSVRQTEGSIAVVLNADSAGSLADLPPDIADAAGLWQLNGGQVHTYRTANRYSLTCELPLIQFSENRQYLSRRAQINEELNDLDSGR